MGQTDLYMGEGDQLPSLRTILEDELGPIDLSGYSVSVYGRKVGSDELIAGVAAIDPDQSANPGVVSYAWGAADTTVPGRWYIQWKATSGGKTVTFPNTGVDELWVDEFWAGAQ